MVNCKRSLVVGALGAVLLCAGFGAHAQESGNSVIGPPQLKDFSLTPRERLVTQPRPAPAPAEVAPPPSARTEPGTERRPASPTSPAPVPERRLTPVRPSGAPGPAAEAPLPTLPLDSAEAPAPAPAADGAAPDEPAAAPVAEPDAWPAYLPYTLPVAALAFGLVLVGRRRSRRAAERDAVPEPAAAPAPPPVPRPDPVPRPWLELSLKAERCAFTATEAEVLFELEIANKGGSQARNLRIDVKMFNAGAEQDREIGTFFRTAGRDTTKLNLPGVDAGVVGVIHGSVRLPVDEMKALKLDERLLFIPVVAVNALYDWGEGRSGQTSKSYVIGREREEPGAKMGAFRVDQGPRIWRTVGQRQHNLAKRV